MLKVASNLLFGNTFFEFVLTASCSEFYCTFKTHRSKMCLQVILKMRSNTLAWNPMEAYIFTAANEDYK